MEKQTRIIEAQFQNSKDSSRRSLDVEYLKILYDKGAPAPVKAGAMAGLISNDRERKAGYLGGPPNYRYNLMTGIVVDGLEMHGADLMDVNFSNSVIINSNFSGSDLGGDWFTDSDLTGTKFEYAQLLGAVFDRANLTGASFRDACLAGADLAQTNVQLEQMSGACGDEHTKLPPPLSGFSLPACHFRSSIPDEDGLVHGYLQCRK